MTAPAVLAARAAASAEGEIGRRALSTTLLRRRGARPGAWGGSRCPRPQPTRTHPLANASRPPLRHGQAEGRWGTDPHHLGRPMARTAIVEGAGSTGRACADGLRCGARPRGMCTIGGRGPAWARGSSVRACGACNARGCEEGGRAERAVPTVCAGLDLRTATCPSYSSWHLNRPSAPQLWEGRPVQCTRVRVCMRGVRGTCSACVSYRLARAVGVCVGAARRAPSVDRLSVCGSCAELLAGTSPRTVHGERPEW